MTLETLTFEYGKENFEKIMIELSTTIKKENEIYIVNAMITRFAAIPCETTLRYDTNKNEFEPHAILDSRTLKKLNEEYTHYLLQGKIFVI